MLRRLPLNVLAGILLLAHAGCLPAPSTAPESRPSSPAPPQELAPPAPPKIVPPAPLEAPPTPPITVPPGGVPPLSSVLPETPPPAPMLQVVTWAEVDGWLQDDPGSALPAFLRSCQVLRRRAGWTEVCAEAAVLDRLDTVAVRSFLEDKFIPYRVSNPDGSDSGTITGYYVPDLSASRTPSERFRFPLYGVPDDLLVIDLRGVYPELGNYRLRGRLEGRRVVPYWDREAIDSETQPLKGREICWVEDPVELFFLHIQGSGRISLTTGERFLVNYADQNGHPYRSIGKALLDQGAMTRDQMSMQNIKAWARANPEQVGKLLCANPSYVFFRELAGGPEMPPGALGVPLTPERSLAVDPRTTPLGAPVFLATTWPNSPVPLQRLMVAQDTGGAIKGAVRADFFWGAGDEAGRFAGRMKQKGRMWVLLPVGVAPPAGTVTSPRKDLLFPDGALGNGGSVP